MSLGDLYQYWTFYEPLREVSVEEPKKTRIVHNTCKCRKCGDKIESVHVHDFVSCTCGAIFTDGGRDYLRRGWTGGADMNDLIEDLTVYEEQQEDGTWKTVYPDLKRHSERPA